MKDKNSAFQIIDEIYDRRIAYDETRLLYIGLFSRSPNNIFDANYTHLTQDLIQKIYQEPSYEEDVFETLFLIQGEAQKGLEAAKNTFSNPIYANNFQRLYNPDNLSYKCFLTVLALCGAVNVDISDRIQKQNKEYARMRKFLSSAKNLLKTQPDKFISFYEFAVKVWMNEVTDDDDETKILRDMVNKSRRLKFSLLFRKICMEGDLATRGTRSKS
jgi:uncharacterized protein (UPF0332 family)